MKNPTYTYFKSFVYRTVDGRTAMIEVDIDEKLLAETLARRALGTRSGVSQLQDGAITGKITSIIGAGVAG